MRVKFAKDGSYSLHDERSKKDEVQLTKLRDENERLKRRIEKLKQENDTLNELAAHYRERHQELLNKLITKAYGTG